MIELEDKSEKLHPGCPCLGMKSDPKTRFMYPSTGGTCHAQKKSFYIPLEHQRRSCLTDQFVHCPIFNQPEQIPSTGRIGTYLPLVILILIVVASLVGWGSWLLTEIGVENIFAYG